ncbi:MAG: hypothetical protein EA398_01610 [Deltaproteobacteria bacterium]|nr:MAG: hypothetical protein EA398_01610 [Deltaproteobacteria bacterium]
MKRRRNERIREAVDNVRRLEARGIPKDQLHDAGRKALAPIREDHELWARCFGHVQEGEFDEAIWDMEQRARQSSDLWFYGKLLLPLLGLLPMLALAWSFGAFSGPAQIENPDPKCMQGLHGALGAFQQEMPFRFGAAQAEELASTGTLSPTWRRDGVQITVRLRLVGLDDGCLLRATRMRRVQPGQTTSTSGNFGQVEIRDCVCE